jgi:pyrroloquinoline quinone biosynthesis protein B
MKSLLIPILLLASTSVWGQNSAPFVVILGITQDGGYPHIGCVKECCKNVQHQVSSRSFRTSLALADPSQKKWWLFEATPDIAEQLDLMQTLTKHQFNYLPDGIFITHAHIGHYTGLMYLGREALGSKNIPVYILPKMAEFLSRNGPWSQLVSLQNIKINVLQPAKKFSPSNAIFIEPVLVPHRDEYSETVGFRIETPIKKYLFIPDIDKWSKWNRNLVEEVKAVDIAFIDATFYSTDELPGRDIKEVPHPFVAETIPLFTDPEQKSKIHFIHFNHTNPLLWKSTRQIEFRETGFNLSLQGATH